MSLVSLKHYATLKSTFLVLHQLKGDGVLYGTS